MIRPKTSLASFYSLSSMPITRLLKKHRPSAKDLIILKCPWLLEMWVLAGRLHVWATLDVWAAGALDGGAAGGLR